MFETIIAQVASISSLQGENVRSHKVCRSRVANIAVGTFNFYLVV